VNRSLGGLQGLSARFGKGKSLPPEGFKSHTIELVAFPTKPTLFPTTHTHISCVRKIIEYSETKLSYRMKVFRAVKGLENAKKFLGIV